METQGNVTETSAGPLSPWPKARAHAFTKMPCAMTARASHAAHGPNVVQRENEGVVGMDVISNQSMSSTMTAMALCLDPPQTSVLQPGDAMTQNTSAISRRRSRSRDALRMEIEAPGKAMYDKWELDSTGLRGARTRVQRNNG